MTRIYFGGGKKCGESPNFANLSDFIIVWDVDASRHTRASKGENIKAVEKIKISR